MSLDKLSPLGAFVEDSLPYQDATLLEQRGPSCPKTSLHILNPLLVALVTCNQSKDLNKKKLLIQKFQESSI